MEELLLPLQQRRREMAQIRDEVNKRVAWKIHAQKFLKELEVERKTRVLAEEQARTLKEELNALKYTAQEKVKRASLPEDILTRRK